MRFANSFWAVFNGSLVSPIPYILDPILMKRLLLLFILMFASVSFATEQEGRFECLHALKKYNGEKWCDSDDRKACLQLHGAEWCDGSVETDLEKTFVDGQLNETYRKLIKKASDSQRKSIKEAQRLWVQYVSHECDARSDMLTVGDPVMRSSLWNACHVDFRKARIKDFEREFCSYLKGC